jgi:HEAT repeat protein
MRIKMQTSAGLCAGLLISLVFAISIALADTVETFIKQLKDPSPEVRIKAAEELCLS